MYQKQERTNTYYWLSTNFEQYTNVQDVLRDAQQQVPLLNSILRLKYGVRISSLNVDDVYRVDEQDRLIKETALFPPITGRRATSESLLQTINAQHPNIAALWHVVQKYPEVEEAMQHFANQWNWFNLYKAYEVIMVETLRFTRIPSKTKCENRLYVFERSDRVSYAPLLSMVADKITGGSPSKL